MKAIITGLLLLVTLTVDAQQDFYFTLKPGYTFTGIHKDLEDAMTSSSFNNVSVSWFGGGNTKHPFTSRGWVGFIAELEIKGRDKISYSFSGGLADWGEVLGYDDVGMGHFLFIDYYNWVISPLVNYRYSYNKVSVGPAVGFITFAPNQGSWDSKTAVVPGISVSNSFFGKKDRKVKAGFFLEANLFTNTHIKEIRISSQGLDGNNGGPATYTSTLQRSKVNGSNLRVGIAIEF